MSYTKFTNILIHRTAFSCWIVSNIMLQFVSRYTAYSIGIVGGLQILTCILWVIIRNETPLIIPFENGTLTLHFGLHFWMSLTCGKNCCTPLSYVH